MASRSLAARRASAELNDAAAALAGEVAPREPAPATLSVADVVDRLSAAIGLPAVAAGVGSAVRGRSSSVPGFGAVQEDAVDLARSSWLDTVTAGLPRPWTQDVDARVASTAELRLAVTDALTLLTLSARRSVLAAWLVVAAVLLAGAAVLVGSLAVGSMIGAGDANVWAPVVAVVLAVAAVAAAVGAGAARRSAARRRSARVLADGRSALESVARSRLAVPTEAVLAEHRTVRELVGAAKG